MNNNYFGFNPNLIRNVPFTNVANSAMNMPRGGILSSLLGGGSRASSGVIGGTSKITFSGILNGASKTLGVINQAIPVFYQVKPVFNNAKTMFRVAKEINKSNKTNDTSLSKIENEHIKNKENKNNPTFFI